MDKNIVSPFFLTHGVYRLQWFYIHVYFCVNEEMFYTSPLINNKSSLTAGEKLEVAAACHVCSARHRVSWGFTSKKSTAVQSTSHWQWVLLNKKAVLSQGEPRDAAVNFDTYQILQRDRVVSLPLPTYMITVPKRYRRTDGQTTCNLITALCVASRGKNKKRQYWDCDGVMMTPKDYLDTMGVDPYKL